MADQSSPLFRKAAIKHFSSPEQLDQLVRITSPKAWIGLLIIYLLLGLFVGWTIVGEIPSRVLGQGLLLAEKGSIYNAVVSEGAGRVFKILVKPNAHVVKGQVLIELENLEMDQKVTVRRSYLSHLRSKYVRLQETAKTLIGQRQSRIAMQNNLLKKMLASGEKNLNYTAELMEVRKQAHKKGLETKQRLVSTVNDYYEIKRLMDENSDRIMQNKMNEANFIDQWQERLRELDLKIKDEQHKLDNLQEQQKLGKLVLSPTDGIVTTVYESIGERVKQGDAVVGIASTGYGMDAVIYVAAKEGKKIKPAMSALVTPANTQREEYGSIRGKVISVSSYPVSQKAMIAQLHNASLVKQFANGSAAIAVRIRLISDPKAKSGFQWTSSQGPNQKITPGTLATARIITRKQAPITLFIPAFKKLLNIE